MADVYLASTQGPGGFQKLLVVKLARGADGPMFATMFLDEARIAAQLSHPNIVQTYEVGEEGSRHYIVMEYLDGTNLARLRHRARKSGGVPLRVVVQVLVAVLGGLDYAHKALGIDGRPLQIVHRDLTPSNILITAHGEVKIVDFGIAKATGSFNYTQTSCYGGKVHYIPPEQLRAEPVDGRADLFTIGVVLAESVRGSRLWGDATDPAIAARLLAGDIPTLDDVPDASAEVRRICAKALAADPKDRYADAAAFKADLVELLATMGGPMTRDALGAYVCETVAEDRARLQTVLDTQLQRVTPVPFAARPILPRLETGPVHLRAGTEDNEIVVERAATVEPVAPEPEPTAPVVAVVPSKHGRVALVAGGVALLVAGVLIGVFARSPGQEAHANPSPPPPAPAPAPATPVVIAGPSTARVEVLIRPAEATIKLDGRALGANPFLGLLPRDEQVHELVISAPGYVTLTRKLVIDQNVLLQLQLEPAPTAPRPARATPPPAPPRPVTELPEPPHAEPGERAKL